MFGLKHKAKMLRQSWVLLRQSWVAGATNTGNVTATVGNKLVLNWHGTPTQRDDCLRIFPVMVRDKFTPGMELGNCADAIIATIHDGGMSPDGVGSNIQISLCCGGYSQRGSTTAPTAIWSLTQTCTQHLNCTNSRTTNSRSPGRSA
jgi:hypothetical protein